MTVFLVQSSANETKLGNLVIKRLTLEDTHLMVLLRLLKLYKL